ncbi:hypothetical protein E4U59_000757 [Claviceps monticola]|nr:hypothetical protein E4U59_000757 [Claviceps monticola]
MQKPLLRRVAAMTWDRAAAAKIGTPVMLLRNICPVEGLCNGLFLLPSESEGRKKNVVHPEVLPSDDPPVDPMLDS